jgi:hypothetical protein
MLQQLGLAWHSQLPALVDVLRPDAGWKLVGKICTSSNRSHVSPHVNDQTVLLNVESPANRAAILCLDRLLEIFEMRTE